MPLRFAILGRRLLYYWTILNKPDKELVKQVLLAQKDNPVRNDWCNTIIEDFKYLDIELTDDEISSMKRANSKQILLRKLEKLPQNIC